MAELSLEELSAVLEAPAVSSESGRARGYQSPQQWRQALALDDLEDREGLPRGLMTAVLTRESHGYPTVRSKAGAQGLFQFMPATAQAYQIDPLNPEQAAAAAAKELGSHYKRYGGDLSQTLAAWNWGSGNLQKKGMANAPKETRNFISWITGLLEPRSAEADERHRSQGAATAAPSGPLTLEGLEQLFGTPAPGGQQPQGGASPAPTGSQPPPPVSRLTPADGRPSPPPATSTPAQDAAYRQWAAQQGEGGTQVPAPTSQAARQLLVDPAARQEPPSLSLRTPSDVSIDIEKTSPPGPEPDKGVLSDLPPWAKWAAATGVSTVGGLGGAALGSVVGPVGSVAGELGGSYLARWLNVKLGLEEPGLVGDIASVAVPAAFRGVGAVMRGGIPRLPGAGAVRHEAAQEALEGLEGRVGPLVESEVLLRQAGQHNAPIATGNLWRESGALLRAERALPRSTQNQEVIRVAQDMLDMARQSPRGAIPMQHLNAVRMRVRLLMDQASRDNWPQAQGLRRIYGSMMDDIEAAATRGVPGARQLKEGLTAYRQERALDDLTDLWSMGKGLQETPAGEVYIYGKRILNNFEKKLTDDPRFRGSFSPQELTDIRQTLRDVSRLTPGPPGGGVLSRRFFEIGGAVTGTSLGGPLTGMAMAAAPTVIAAAMRTQAGRWAIRQAMAEGKGRLTAAGYAMINEAVRKGLEAAEPERPQPGLSGRPGQWP